MKYISPQVTYSVTILDDSLIITPGDTSQISKDQEVESLGYRFAANIGITIKDGKIHILPSYKPILGQNLPDGVIDSLVDINDIEFGIYLELPYLILSEKGFLLTQVSEELFEVLDPAKPNNYCSTIVDNKPMLINISYLGRAIKAKELTLGKNVEFVSSETDDYPEILKNSYFKKYNNEFNFDECKLVKQDGYLTLITDNFHQNVDCVLARVKASEF